jgi:hypothetical protein
MPVQEWPRRPLSSPVPKFSWVAKDFSFLTTLDNSSKSLRELKTVSKFCSDQVFKHKKAESEAYLYGNPSTNKNLWLTQL